MGTWVGSGKCGWGWGCWVFNRGGGLTRKSGWESVIRRACPGGCKARIGAAAECPAEAGPILETKTNGGRVASLPWEMRGFFASLRMTAKKQRQTKATATANKSKGRSRSSAARRMTTKKQTTRATARAKTTAKGKNKGNGRATAGQRQDNGKTTATARARASAKARARHRRRRFYMPAFVKSVGRVSGKNSGARGHRRDQCGGCHVILLRKITKIVFKLHKRAESEDSALSLRVSYGLVMASAITVTPTTTVTLASAVTFTATVAATKSSASFRVVFARGLMPCISYVAPAVPSFVSVKVIEGLLAVPWHSARGNRDAGHNDCRRVHRNRSARDTTFQRQ